MILRIGQKCDGRWTVCLRDFYVSNPMNGAIWISWCIGGINYEFWSMIADGFFSGASFRANWSPWLFFFKYDRTFGPGSTTYRAHKQEVRRIFNSFPPCFIEKFQERLEKSKFSSTSLMTRKHIAYRFRNSVAYFCTSIRLKITAT